VSNLQLKDKRVKLILLVLIVGILILNIKKQELDSSFLLQSYGSADDYHGEIIHVDGYAVRFPFRIYYVKGTATINDIEWDMKKLSYSRKFREYCLKLFEGRVGGYLYLEYDLDSGSYNLRQAGYGSYSSIPIE